MIRKNYIPTININPILKNNFNSKATLKITREIEKACVEVGFFQIVGHGIKIIKMFIVDIFQMMLMEKKD